MKRFLSSLAVVMTMIGVIAAAAYWRQQALYSEADRVHPSAEEPKPVTGVWVGLTTKAYVLDEILMRDEQGDAIRNIREYSDELTEVLERRPGVPFDAYQILLDSGALFESDHGFRAQTNVELWNTGGQLPQESTVSEALNIALEANEVGWCGEAARGDVFVREYQHTEDHLDSREKAEGRIQEYVECGSSASASP